MTEQQLLDAARGGDERAFGELITAHRSELYVHCYRMLGSTHDAEDALQEALLRAWRGLDGFAGRSSLRGWLYKIATNASLRAIERRPRRALPVDFGAPADPHDPIGAPLTESVWIEPLPDTALEPVDVATPEARYERRESVELAFVAALQLLPARQRAVLVLRDVLGFSAAEVADALDTTAASVNSALQRAHKTVDAHLPEHSQQAALSALGDAELRAIVDAYTDAWERGDVAALTALLTEDATFSMPPQAIWFRGPEAIAEFLSSRPFADGRTFPGVPAPANGQLAFAHYKLDPATGTTSPHGVTVLTIRADRIAAIVTFLMPELIERFGLPATLRRR